MAQKGRNSKHHPWFFGLRFVLLMAAWDGYRIPVGFRLILPKRCVGYRSENALFREMVGAFVPPSWAKLVIVGGDAAYGSKANMRMVQDREKTDSARRWGFVFAIARTWKNAPGFPEGMAGKGARRFGHIALACVCVMSVTSLWC